MFIYWGKHNKAKRIRKIGQTKRTCKARCSSADYTITMGYDYDDITASELTMLESVVRVVMERKGYSIIGMDYMTMPKGKHDNTATQDFMQAVDIANAVYALVCSENPDPEQYKGDCMVYHY